MSVHSWHLHLLVLAELVSTEGFFGCTVPVLGLLTELGLQVLPGLGAGSCTPGRPDAEVDWRCSAFGFGAPPIGGSMLGVG